MKKELRAEAKVKKAEAKKKAELTQKLKIGAIIAIPCLLIIAIVVIAAIAKDAYSLKVDYSEGLTADGKIAGINVADYVKVCDYANIVVPKSEVEMTEDDLNEYVDSILTDNEIEELTDEFIVENYSDVASTVDEYLEYVKTSTMEENVKDYIYEYLISHSTVKSYPRKYLKVMKNQIDKSFLYQFNYNNELLYAYTGSYQWSSYLDYYGVSRSKYKDMVEATAKDAVAESLILQYIYEELNLSITDEEILEVASSLGYTADDAGLANATKDYTLPYIKQITADNKVIDYLAEKVTIE